MSLALRLDLRQTQGLVMTPQLQQAIKLLQLSNLDLATYVATELEQNPFLERADEPDEADRTPEHEGDVAPVADEAGAELSGDLAMTQSRAAGDDWTSVDEEGWVDPGRDEPANGIAFGSVGYDGRGGSFDLEPDDDLGARLSRDKTLHEHLLEQLLVDLPDGPERLIGAHLIDLLDDAGYLRADLDQTAERLGCSRAALDGVLARLQQFDPPGVFARSLEECLALQLRDRGRLDPAMQALLEHLDLLARYDLAALVKVCGVLPDDLPEMIAEIKALDPRPGAMFTQETAYTVVPDVFVFRLADGSWRVELNSATLPRVLVNNTYYARLKPYAGDRQAKEYVTERFQSAAWLAKALDQRARTVLKVAEAVVERQLPFFEHGIQHLRPMVLRDIAEATELHESTVSRATADKYLATPRGTFPFRYFFTTALAGTDSASPHSAEAIRQRIKAMIEREDPEQVLSDDQIVATLRAEGVTIARRTVAKYRESLGIASSVQRRRTKALRLA